MARRNGGSFAIAVALFKYRLYDIDRIINRTLVYGLLTILLGAVYLAGVFGLGLLLNPVTGESALAVAASTWPWRPCSSRPAAASKRWWIGASTAAATTRPGRSRDSAAGCGTRSTWIPSPSSCSQ